MKRPEIEKDPFQELIKILSDLSAIFSFKSMISMIPELIAYAIKYGMMVQNAYQEEIFLLDEDKKGSDQEAYKKRITSRLKEDFDKLSLYL